MKKQIALCIGIDRYDTSVGELTCAVNDAKDMAAKLESLKYDVILLTDATIEQIDKTIDELKCLLPNYDVALFYFAGHGFQDENTNYLAPVDIHKYKGSNMIRHALKLDDILKMLDEQDLDVKILILDACRNKLKMRGKSSQGFAPVSAPEGTIIAFATSPGQVAMESNGHGEFTSALLQHIDLPRIPIENMFKKVRESLAANTEGEQISWEHTSLMGDYYFNEDRVDAFSVYSSDAIADENYIFASSSPVAEIVKNLKIHDWDYQNPVMTKLKSVNWNDVSVNDMFVLGRNIYQAAVGRAWGCIFVISNLDLDYHEIPDAVKVHILNGMTFEIYFNKSGKLREEFKTGCYEQVLELLANRKFHQCRNYISDRLLNEKGNKVIYVPCDEERFEFEIKCSESATQGVLQLESIYWHGKNIFVRNEEYADICIKVREFKRRLCEKIVAPQDMVRWKFDFEIDEDTYITLPFAYTLKHI